MDTLKLIGMKVFNRNKNAYGKIKSVIDGFITIDYHGEEVQYAFPSAFSNILELEDEDLQKELMSEGIQSSFETFKKIYANAVNGEIEFLNICMRLIQMQSITFQMEPQ